MNRGCGLHLGYVYAGWQFCAIEGDAMSTRCKLPRCNISHVPARNIKDSYLHLLRYGYGERNCG